MSELLREIIVGVLSCLTTGGLGSILYFRLQKKLKESEVKSAELENKNKEITNMSAVNAEWERICKKLSDERDILLSNIKDDETIINGLHDKIDALNRSKESAWEQYSNCRIDCARKDRMISELNWYRCEVNGCPYRKPPRNYGDFDFPGNVEVIENNNNEPKELV